MKFIKLNDFEKIEKYKKNYLIKEDNIIFQNYVNELSNILNLKFDLKFDLIDYEDATELFKKKNDKINIFTISPKKYEKLIENKVDNAFLYIVSVEENFSNLNNFSKYVNSNNIKNKKKLIFKLRYFKKFLFDNYPKKKIIGFFNRLFSLVNLNIKKRYIYKSLWIPILVFNDTVYKGNYIGLGKYNYVYKKSNEYIKKYNFIIDNLEDEESKYVFKISNFAKPKFIWEYYFKNLVSYPHYTEFLPKRKNSVILNLGVASGFEIPFFLDSNISRLINVDPTGDDLLHPYVKIFCDLNKQKISFNKKFLYNDERVYLKSNAGKTTVKDIIDEYNLERLDLIKSDIEGSEVFLLKEIESIIKQFRPMLALSIYHRRPIEDQIIEIPHFLISRLKNYKYYIRHYTYNKWDTIIYCCPD